eukprot:8937029-Alexandrium_andersonii.AAC.1
MGALVLNPHLHQLLGELLLLVWHGRLRPRAGGQFGNDRLDGHPIDFEADQVGPGLPVLATVGNWFRACARNRTRPPDIARARTTPQRACGPGRSWSQPWQRHPSATRISPETTSMPKTRCPSSGSQRQQSQR